VNKTETENGVKRFSNTEIRYIFQIADSDSPIAPVHSHTFYEILYVLRGGCTQYINENEYSMNAGMLLILSPGDIHGFKKKEKDTEVLCLSVSRDEFIKYEYLFGRSFPALTMEQMQNSIKVNPSTAQLLLCFCNDLSLFFNDNRLRSLCVVLLGAYADADRRITATVPETLQQLTARMSAETALLKEGLSAMIRITNYSASQLNRLIKKHYHETPHSYLKKLRLQKARNMLLETDFPPESIAEFCGYSCYGHFTGIFKEYFGLSPAALRAMKI